MIPVLFGLDPRAAVDRLEELECPLPWEIDIAGERNPPRVPAQPPDV